jgi:hypothetical protein
MNMDIRFLVVAGLAALFTSSLHAAVYQWTDEQGRVHYSDRPVHESAKQMKLRKARPTTQNQAIPADRREVRQRMLDVYEQERAEKREAAAEAKQAREERKRRCLNARVDYENYSSAGSIYEFQESGERKYMDKQQRESYLAKLKARVSEYCD